jgi:lipoprotein-anchoring transpeptidase ErfK/SrfK
MNEGTMRTILAGAAAIALLQLSAVAAEASTLIAKISISSQTMTVTENGFVKYRWKVSTARSGYVTPVGSWSAKWLSRDHRSKKYDDAPMPYAVFFNGGYAVHATFDLKRLGRPASHRCIRLHPNNAAQFFDMTRQAGLANTRVVVTN